jgi:hypothetical protein
MRSPFFLICIGGSGVQTGPTRQIGQLLAYCTLPLVIVRMENLVE